MIDGQANSAQSVGWTHEDEQILYFLSPGITSIGILLQSRFEEPFPMVSFNGDWVGIGIAALPILDLRVYVVQAQRENRANRKKSTYRRASWCRSVSLSRKHVGRLHGDDASRMCLYSIVYELHAAILSCH